MLRLVQLLLGGRPMKYEGPAFIDGPSCIQVNFYSDHKGKLWLAQNSWSRFRQAVRQQNLGE